MGRVHDIPGTHREWVGLGAYTASSDDGKRDVIFEAPFKLHLLGVSAFFQGTADVVGGTASDYFTYTVYDGTVPIGTAGVEGTVSFGDAFSIYSGTRLMSEDDNLALEYGTAGGTAGLDAPRALIQVQFRGG